MPKFLALCLVFALALVGNLTTAQADSNPIHNFSNPYDVDGNGFIQPRDGLLVINQLQRLTTPNAQPLVTTQTFFYDTNNDSRVSPVDVLLVINHMAQTPEPGSIISAGIGAVMLAGYAWRRRRLKAA